MAKGTSSDMILLRPAVRGVSLECAQPRGPRRVCRPLCVPRCCPIAAHVPGSGMPGRPPLSMHVPSPPFCTTSAQRRLWRDAAPSLIGSVVVVSRRGCSRWLGADLEDAASVDCLRFVLCRPVTRTTRLPSVVAQSSSRCVGLLLCAPYLCRDCLCRSLGNASEVMGCDRSCIGTPSGLPRIRCRGVLSPVLRD